MSRTLARASALLGRLRGRLQAAADLKLRPLVSVGAWDAVRRGVFALEEGAARLVSPWLLGVPPALAATGASISPVDDTHAAVFEAYLRAHGQQVAWLRELRARRGATVLAAWWQGRVLGHVVLVPRAPLPDGRTAVQLVNFHVGPSLRGRGLGRRLLAAFRAEARGRGASVIRLTVNRGDARAVAFYRRAGFVAIDDPRRIPVPGREAMEGPV